MTIAFKELAGSPVETYGPDGFRARRRLVCAWDDRHGLLEQLLGDGYEFGGHSRAPYPDTLDAVAMRVRCEPLIDDLVPQMFQELTEGLNRYRGLAKVTVDYELLLPADGAELVDVAPGTFLSYQQDFAGETSAVPAHALVWQGEPDVPVMPEAQPRLHITIVEHRLTWHRVVRPPWDAMRRSAGTVNLDSILGAAAGTVLLAGARAQREFIRIGRLKRAELAWRIGYVFRERVVQTPDSSIAGWNHAYRSLPATSPGWDELADADGNRLYRATDFSRLFQLAENGL